MKKILLTNEKFAIIDDEDFDKVNPYKWRATKFRSTYYARRDYRINGKKTTVYMHREIMNPKNGIQIDHINHNGLDNRKANLRFCTNQQNHFNQKKLKTNTSGFKGVQYNKLIKKWYAKIMVNGKEKYLGSFTTPMDAAQAYNIAAERYHGEFACLNIIK